MAHKEAYGRTGNYHGVVKISSCFIAAGVEIQEVKGLMSTLVDTDESGRSCSSTSDAHLKSEQGCVSPTTNQDGKAQGGWVTPSFCTVTVATTYIPHMVSRSERKAISTHLRNVRYSCFSHGMDRLPFRLCILSRTVKLHAIMLKLGRRYGVRCV